MVQPYWDPYSRSSDDQNHAFACFQLFRARMHDRKMFFCCPTFDSLRNELLAIIHKIVCDITHTYTIVAKYMHKIKIYSLSFIELLSAISSRQKIGMETNTGIRALYSSSSAMSGVALIPVAVRTTTVMSPTLIAPLASNLWYPAAACAQVGST